MNDLRVVLTCLAVAAALAPRARAEDIVRVRGGTAVAGRIVGLTRAGAEIRQAEGASRTLAFSEIEAIEFGDLPEAARRAEADLKERRFDKAAEGYRAALAEIDGRADRPWLAAFLHMQAAGALGAQGDLDGARRELRAVLDAGPSCHLRERALLDSLAIATRKKDASGIARILALLEAEPEPLASAARLERAKSAYRNGEFRKSQELLAGIASDHPRAAEARLWTIRCLFALGRGEELERACRDALGEHGDTAPALTQAAGAALAAVLMERAGAADETALREALLAGLQALSAGPPGRGDGTEDYVRALLAAGRAYARLAACAKAPELARLYLRRAAAYWGEAARVPGGGADAAKAAEESAALGVQEARGAK